jgi:hypothetical protein
MRRYGRINNKFPANRNNPRSKCETNATLRFGKKFHDLADARAIGSGMWFGRADLVFRPPVSMTGRSDECTPFHNREAEKS